VSPIATATAPSTTTGSSPIATPGAPGGSGLEGTKWDLVSFGPKGAEKQVIAGSTVTLEFQDATRLGGNGGCNSYGADYQAEGNTLAVSSIVSTMMACADDKVTQQEAEYFQALQKAGEYQISGDQLVITYDNGAGTLTFTRQS
jgi:heat shock protein HslJ